MVKSWCGAGATRRGRENRPPRHGCGGRRKKCGECRTTGARGNAAGLRGRGDESGIQCEKRGNRLGELNAYLRSFPPSRAATADGCVVKHKIECIGNSNVAFHIKAGAPVRQVADRTIDRRPAALEGDTRSQESTAAVRFMSELLLRVFHLFDLPTIRGCVPRGRRAYAGSLAPNMPREPHAKVTREPPR